MNIYKYIINIISYQNYQEVMFGLAFLYIDNLLNMECYTFYPTISSIQSQHTPLNLRVGLYALDWNKKRNNQIIHKFFITKIWYSFF